MCPECNSFGMWCEQNNKNNIINLWSEDNKNIYSVSRSSAYTASFLCPNKKHNNFSVRISDISSGKIKNFECPLCNSFGEFLYDKFGKEKMDEIWSIKNKKSPYDYSKNSGKKVIINCDCCGNEYETQPYVFINKKQEGCKKCNFSKESFVDYHIKNTCEDFINEYLILDSENDIDNIKSIPLYSNKKLHFKCQSISYHDYYAMASSFTSGNRCPYCKKLSNKVHRLDSFGTKHPEIMSKWSEKNEKDPYSYREFSHKKVWLKCEKGIHEDYLRRIADYSNGFCLCSKCVQSQSQSSLEQKVINFLNDKGFEVKTELDCSISPINPITKNKLRYDNEITVNNIQLIIEVHGIQHYEISGFHITQAKRKNTTKEQEFEYGLYKDKLKKDYALSHGYEFLEIPYWTEENYNYKTTLLKKIIQLNNITS